MTCWGVVGGAGFIGSHVVARLLEEGDDSTRVRVIDNLSSGSRERLSHIDGDTRLEFTQLDVKDLDELTDAVRGADHLFHFAANPDIAAAVNYASNKGAKVINMSLGGYGDSAVLRDALAAAYPTSVLVAAAGNDAAAVAGL